MSQVTEGVKLSDLVQSCPFRLIFRAEKGNPEEQAMEHLDYKNKDEDD